MKIYGAKRQKQSSHKPYIQKDTATSTNFYQALYGLSEGEIYGLVDGGKFIRLDGSPLSMIMASQTFLMYHGSLELAVLTKSISRAFHLLKMSKVSM